MYMRCELNYHEVRYTRLDWVRFIKFTYRMLRSTKKAQCERLLTWMWLTVPIFSSFWSSLKFFIWCWKKKHCYSRTYCLVSSRTLRLFFMHNHTSGFSPLTLRGVNVTITDWVGMNENFEWGSFRCTENLNVYSPDTLNFIRILNSKLCVH